MKKIFFTLFVFILPFFYISANAQKNDSCLHRYLGIGIRSSVFQISELKKNIVAPNRLFLNIDPIQFLRIEAQFGAYRQSDAPYSGNTSVQYTENSSVAGFGIFGVDPVGKIRFLAGCRYISSVYGSNNSSSSSVSIDKGKANMLSGVIGADYIFSKWFSVGGEFSLININDKYTTSGSASTSTSTTTTRTIITESCLIFRFYPF